MQTDGNTFYGHSGNLGGAWEPLAEHLQAVADTAAAFARAFGAHEWARLAGRVHDLGKYSPRFTRRLQGHGRAGDHAAAGALLVLHRYADAGLPAALAILGHHGGLTDLPAAKELRDRLARRFVNRCPDLTDPDFKAILQRFQADGLTLPTETLPRLHKDRLSLIARMLEVRMLYSALVDADFLETEAHFNGSAEKPRANRPPGPALQAERAMELLQEHLRRVRASCEASGDMARLRADLLAACEAGASLPPGLFTLSAPTGAGKTLAMLAFALRHALAHPQHPFRRIVLVIPFLTIIEQTAKVYRDVFQALGPDYVLEDHSLARVAEGPASERGRLLAENWDAPVVLTTSVKCLESLFARTPSDCRKLHRLANSIVLFDEVQTLPTHLAVPTLAALSRMSERFGCTVVFSTATQPAFDALHEHVSAHAPAGWRPRELAGPELGLFERSRRRTRVHWRLGEEQRVEWDALADELADREQVLCVVNLTRHAADLAGRVRVRVRARARERSREGTFHLSTRMCPAHRTAVLAEVRQRLKEGWPCRLISTQCIEAGVDVDFPAVYRAFGPLEALAQAAGRCNRHGVRPQVGEVVVFRPAEEAFPPGGYRQAAQATASHMAWLQGQGRALEDLDLLSDPQALHRYFRTLYDLTAPHAAPAEARALMEALEVGSFTDVAREYRLIRQDSVSVLVPYDGQAFDDLQRQAASAESFGELRDWFARAQAHAVAVYRRADKPLWNVLRPVEFGPLREPDEALGWFVLLDEGAYDAELLGLQEPEGWPIL